MNRKERRAALKMGGPAANTSLTPRQAEALDALALGQSFRADGQTAAAETQFNHAIKLDPKSADAHQSLASLLMEQDRLDEAMVHVRRALTLRPNGRDATLLHVMLLKQQGQRAEAAIAHERMLASDPQSRTLRDQLLGELTASWARPTDLARAAVPFIRLNPAIAACAARSTKAWPKPLTAEQLFGPTGLGAIAGDPLLRFLLEACAIYDIELERLLTRARGILLTMAHEEAETSEDVTAWCCALASQCFLTEYVFSADADEIRDAERLRDRLTASVESGQDFPAIWLPAVACYFPLHSLPALERLLDKVWPASIARLLTQQIAEPREERAFRAAMPALTPIEDATSQKVRQQYEENPYPRWMTPKQGGETVALDTFIREQFPRARYHANGLDKEIDILVAGCGTGQNSIETAQRFGGSRMHAIDLSLASLGYAQRQSRACGLDSIQYAQADIMNLPATGKSFDLIESCGVMHHMADPLEAWRRLLSMLRPRGVMHVGFYSELARHDIVAAQCFIKERGHGDSAEAIRRGRQDIIACADGTAVKNVTTFPAFFSTSECRDMLFHVMEHRLTLPGIAAFLEENDLEFLGFDIDEMVQTRYANRFPSDPAMTDLGNWHRFEERNPSTFVAMYLFWVQKRT